MARVLQEHVKRPLAEELLFGKLAGGGHVLVRLAPGGDSLVLDIRPVKSPELLGQE
jgi:ATP-dependent Clp protease ATP-binding subunit ClpA